MVTSPLEATPSSLFCPSCHTVCTGLPSRCPWCGILLEWVAHWPELGESLRSLEGRRRVLEVTLQSPAWSITRQTNGENQLTILDPEGNRWSFSAAAHAAKIEYAGQCQEYSLPTRDCRIAGAQIQLRELVEPEVNAAARRISAFLTGDVRLDATGRCTLGRDSTPGALDQLYVCDAHVSWRHCLIVKEQAEIYWIIDLGTPGGTYVNGTCTLAARLQPGDIVQVGDHGWIYIAEDRSLIPLEPIAGSAITIRELEVTGRLQSTSLDIPSGQFVAVVGPSGAGKSTLLKAMLNVPGYRGRGTIALDGVDFSPDGEKNRRQLGYVSQKEVLHDELPVMEAILLSARLRGVNVSTEQVRRLLRRLEVPKRCRVQPVRSLSGGELKRVRVAAELAAKPNCLLLDEPASGLDPRRERELMRLLHGLSIQGCTVLLVTHGLNQLAHVDRVLVIQRGQTVFDGTQAQLQEAAPDGDLSRVFSPVTKQAATSVAKRLPQRSVDSAPHGRKRQHQARQLYWLMRREASRLLAAWKTKLLVPLLGLPILFAVILHLATPPTKTHVLGFLAILACIWNSGSLSLRAIVEERHVVDHERLLFLNYVPYVASKVVVLWLLAAIQTVVFLGLLHLLRLQAGPSASFHDVYTWCLASLVLVSLAAVSLGLVISALSKWVQSTDFGHYVFPLVMMCQMVLSVQVAGRGDAELARAYEEWSWRTPKSTAATATSKTVQETLCVAGSYFTLSRYGDLMLRSFAYFEWDHRKFHSASAGSQNQSTWRAAAAVLLFGGGVGPVVAVILLRIAERKAGG